MSQYDKNLWNNTYVPGQRKPITPEPPFVYYVSLLLGMLSFAVTVIGLLAIGVLAVRAGGQAKYSLN